MKIRYVEQGDREFWFRLDRHLPEAEFDEKVRNRRGYVALEDGRPVGILRYNLFWDNTPFCTLLCIDGACRSRGYGRALMARWEADMRALGYGAALTSTQVDESAQHFYRRIGYRDCGGIVFDIPGFEQPMEMFLIKDLSQDGRE